MKRRKSRKRRYRQIRLLFMSLCVLLVISVFTYMKLKPKVAKAVTIEAGTSGVNIQEFIMDESESASFLTDIHSLDFRRPGTYDVQIAMDGKVYISKLNVVDTVPPKGESVNYSAVMGENVPADALVTNITDATNVTVSFKQIPDTSIPGDQEVVVLLEDAGGNKTEMNAMITVTDDTEAPEILGVRDKTVYIGDTVSHRKGVTVTDNRDEEIELQIDSSKVNLKREGTYQVTYSAIDSAGNVAIETASITVKSMSVSQETLNQLADDVLYQILNEGMTQKEIAKKIYTWTKGHIAYTGDSDKSDWMAEAYRGFKNGVGDCFTYFCVSQALLNRAGIDNVGLTRDGGKTRHYWSLINLGEGWYHFDSTPNKDHRDSFYLTETEVVELTDIRGNNYYVYDKTTIDVTPVQ